MMENAGVMVSVIMLTYNHADYIRQALDSVLMQEVSFAYEILVGDDASTDDTALIASEYADRHPDKIRVFARPENLGASKNLYDLLLHASGKYIASCEGDDYWTDPQKLRCQVDFLEKHPAYSGCTHACTVIDADGLPAGDQSLPWVCGKKIYRLRDFKGIYLAGQPATLVHRNFFLDESHDYSVIYRANPMIADRTISLILVLNGPIYRDERDMSCYRRVETPGSVSATSCMFKNNTDVNRMQVELTRALERYAREEFGVRVHFTGFKLEQRVKGIIRRCMLRLWPGRNDGQRAVSEE